MLYRATVDEASIGNEMLTIPENIRLQLQGFVAVNPIEYFCYSGQYGESGSDGRSLILEYCGSNS